MYPLSANANVLSATPCLLVTRCRELPRYKKWKVAENTLALAESWDVDLSGPKKECHLYTILSNSDISVKILE
jgi:hypothetical protein